MMKQHIINSIDEASKVIGKTWPLYTFVASNPLSGYENSSFSEAVNSAEKNFNANAFPSAALYQQAFKKGDIDTTILTGLLKENKLTESPEFYLNLLDSKKKTQVLNENHAVDVVMVKWLSSFMDEGLAEWEMPYKTEGFYTAWRLLVVYDSESTGKTALKDIPKTSIATLEEILKDYKESDYTAIFTHHLAALPGWTGYLNHRTQSGSDWQKEYPIEAMDYLAARLWTAKKLNSPILPSKVAENKDALVFKIQYTFLKAWEQSWQNQLVKTLENESIATTAVENAVPDAQLVFCIDTRSELIRRHIESKGNYETFGYAGFFGITMDYESLNDGITRKSCPPIVNSAYKVSEIAQTNKEGNLKNYQNKNSISIFKEYFRKRMKNMIPSAFGYVEGSGLFYGISLVAKTLMPRKMYQLEDKKASKVEGMCQPDINKSIIENSEDVGIPLTEKVAIVKSAFDLMGWKQFAPLVIFAGHGSHSANNPFSSSLDCGACAASPGRHNARMLAKLANLPEVRQVLKEMHHINIPENTLFLGAEHNTTTDAIILFDSEASDIHQPLIHNLKVSLIQAQKTATEDRLGNKGNSVSSAEKKANNWGETRPEWGLAKNAGFIVGPRNLTKNTNLDSRCFLHSYEWELDTEGKALEGIMQGPMTVTQWINNHYYFSTVDNNVYGGGSKITHNITGKFGVVQGNGGDLKMGLPLQSLFGSDEVMYHQPLRLSVMIQAPLTRVSEIIARNEGMKRLLDNEWIYLMVMDPTSKNEIFNYKKSIQWKSNSI
ncbi:DUF2309 domain-containing protein [Polaribacter litorisediminis]|uniref:DUF2309 domain-containing protein n=1 Tax=Polaribacter litorisediminis TaxID=1908341 RepID=UPI001CBBF11C|nr:DUF2309 domain-containing protein [Polaribacter litorisediminis]UAM99961.1 DUF2309 domain-containing protein [Polaribacter litorisediminis]